MKQKNSTAEKKLGRSDFLIIATLIAVAVMFRYFVVRHGSFPFWFDSARDAIVSREILEKHHLKIQGPNASGTKDTVFHGVLYYYLIGPLYTIFRGDPQMVVYVLGTLTAFAIIPVYFLSFEISESRRTAVLAGILYALSYDAVRAGTWVSNPSLAALTIPLCMYLLWKVFFQKQKKYLPWLMLMLGLTTQSVIFFVTLWGEILLAAWYAKDVKISLKEWAVAVGVFLLTISSMIFAELKMIKAGLLTPSTLASFSLTAVDGPGAVIGTLLLILRKITQSIFPTFPVAAATIFLLAIFTIWKYESKHKQFFLLVVFTGPLWVVGWLFRDMFHAWIGIEAVICMILALALEKLFTVRAGKFLVGLFLILYVVSQMKMWQTEKAGGLTPYFLPQGAYLHDQLALIDKTYELSHGQSFSISTLTNPYGYDTEWAYLYSWYGQKKYGRIPEYFGPDQTGLFGGDLLPRVLKPEKTHFTIYEPPEGIPNYMRASFAENQSSLTGTPSGELLFGTMMLETHG